MFEEHQKNFDQSAADALKQLEIMSDELTIANVGENVTYRVRERTTGRLLALRLHRPGYQSLAELKSERAWQRALAASGISLPLPVINSEGEDLVSVDIQPLQEQRWASATYWLEGNTLSAVLGDGSLGSDRMIGYATQIGRLLAAMHNQAGSWIPPKDFVRPRLDADGLMGAAPFMGRFWDHRLLSSAERDLLLQTRQVLHCLLKRYGETARTFGLIHADLNPDNIILHEGQLTPIDFDDAAFGWYAFDLGVALAPMCTTPEYESYKHACLAGYRSLREFSSQDESLIPTFVLIRRMALLGWYHDRPEVYDAPSQLADLKRWVCETATSFEPTM
jgi:Ser/Thr protein kinase RdoA (MazF antagonist)